MKKTIITVFAFLVVFGFTITGVMAQTWTWESPYETTAKITKMTVDPASDTIYGIDDATGDIVVVTLGDQIDTVSAIATIADSSPNDVTAGSAEKVYVVFDSEVTDWSTGPVYVPLSLQPQVPESNNLGTFKYIATGKYGKLFVYYETGTKQYILIGNPPVLPEAAIVKFSPQTLNLSSKGNWVNVQIQLPGDLDENLIDSEKVRISQIAVEGFVTKDVEIFPAPGAPYSIGTNDEGASVLKLKFIRYNKSGAIELNEQSLTYQLQGILSGANKGKYPVTLTIEGELTDGNLFQGTATFNASVTKKTK